MKTSLKSLLIIFITLTGCDLIEYSPFNANVENSYINEGNIEKLDHLKSTKDTIKFALISDSHSFYKDLEDAISNINQVSDLDFVICSGDITDSGLAWEFKQYQKFIGRLQYPIFTVIGNHDYLSNGSAIYRQMFGPTNFSFNYMQYKFILFDNIVWENNNRMPDFAWLKEQVSSEETPYSVLISHIPSDAEEMKPFYSPEFGNIIENSNIILCMNGHSHSFEQKILSTKPAITSGSVSHRLFNVISLYNGEFSIKQITY